MKIKRIGKLLIVMLALLCTASTVVFTSSAFELEKSLEAAPVELSEYGIPVDSLFNTNKAMPDTWVFTDGLGRVSLTNEDVGNPKKNRTVVMFYWDWHENLGNGEGATNTTELMKLYPDAKNVYKHSAWRSAGRYCFWNEPIYGFYRTSDTWVLRKQAELLANIDVDAIMNDNTNGSFTWREGYLPLYDEWLDAQADGVDVPKISYVFPFWDSQSTKNQLEGQYKIFDDIYSTDKYQSLWFYWDDKPMLMGKKDAMSPEIQEFFTWRQGEPEYYFGTEVIKTEYWGWLSTYPQVRYSKTKTDYSRGKTEQITVGVACNHNYVTHKLTAMNGENVMGRSYTSDYQNRYEVEGTDATLYGYFFQEQFDYALKIKPQVIFITGWNEWHAWRQPEPWGSEGVVNALVDQFDNEYSRDLEPTKGELKDHYYYLAANYIRQYKGVNPIPTPSTYQTIDMSAGYKQWENVAPYYASYIDNIQDRNSEGYNSGNPKNSYYYTETSGRNDIIGAQVARDNDYVYFHVECADNITSYTDTLWMNLYIDSDQSNQGWETFDYVINKSQASEKTLVLEKFTNGYESQKVADVEYSMDGRYMTVKVPKSALGLSGDNFTINFSWTDNVHDEGDYTKYSGDIMDFYISGDVAPGGRFKYSYISTDENTQNPNASAGEDTSEETTDVVTEDISTTEITTDVNTAATTEENTAAITEAETVVTTDEATTPDETSADTQDSDGEKSGCKSTLGVSVLMLPIISAGAICTVKRKKKK